MQRRRIANCISGKFCPHTLGFTPAQDAGYFPGFMGPLRPIRPAPRRLILSKPAVIFSTHAPGRAGSIKDLMKTKPNCANVNLFTPRFIALGALAGLLLLMGLTGCSSGPGMTSAVSSGVITNLAGQYTLVSVDGKPIPCHVFHENTDITVKSGLFTINSDGTCRSETVFFLPKGNDVHRVVDATYTVSGTELTMHWNRAGVTRGTVNGNDFTMNNEGMIFAYRK